MREENKKLKENLYYSKKVINVERTILELIKSGAGSYENIAKEVYGAELNNYVANNIRTVVCRLKKKGNKIINIPNWGYKEETNGQKRNKKIFKTIEYSR